MFDYKNAITGGRVLWCDTQNIRFDGMAGHNAGGNISLLCIMCLKRLAKTVVQSLCFDWRNHHPASIIQGSTMFVPSQHSSYLHGIFCMQTRGIQPI